MREKEQMLKKAEKRLGKGSKLREEGKTEEEDWEDVEEHEKDAFDKEGYFEVPDQAEISKNDEKLLGMLAQTSQAKKAKSSKLATEAPA